MIFFQLDILNVFIFIALNTLTCGGTVGTLISLHRDPREEHAVLLRCIHNKFEAATKAGRLSGDCVTGGVSGD